MTHVEFLEIFNLLQLNYNKRMPDEIIRLWYDKFENVSKDVFKKSVIETIENETFFPTMNMVDKRVEENSRRII